MDEWPELEALAAAIDRYDEWPEMALTDGSLANVIDAARDVVRNYRETLALMQSSHPTTHMPREEPGGDRPRDH